VRCPQRLGHGDVHGMELMVTGHLLGHGSATRVLEDDEMPDQIKQAALVEDPIEHHLQLWQVGIGQSLA
jgi:hypothetical protein